MKRATLERLAAVLVLAACICAECIPLLLVLVPRRPVRGARKFPSDCEFVKKKDRRCCNTRRPRGKRKVDPPLF